MSLSKSKCWFSKNCLHFLKYTVTLTMLCMKMLNLYYFKGMVHRTLHRQDPPKRVWYIGVGRLSTANQIVESLFKDPTINAKLAREKGLSIVPISCITWSMEQCTLKNVNNCLNILLRDIWGAKF